MKELRYPVGVQSFEKLRKEGFVYVDKTRLIHELIKNQYCFLGRPRRFGKSLLLSTLEAYFSGRKELFEGLAIYDLEKDWVRYPVLHFDLNIGDYHSPEGLRNLLKSNLDDYEAIYGRKSDVEDLAIRFRYLVESAHEKTGRSVVILVDEYEKPLLTSIGDDALQDRYRAELKPFYGVLKTCDEHIRFAMLTGVTRLGKMSVFSDLNNLRDISMSGVYSGICGVTLTELLDNFSEGLNEMALRMNKTCEETVELLKKAYDGYRFSEEEGSEHVFNPFSLLNAFASKKVSDYWFETGTPSFLIELLKNNCLDLWDMDNAEVGLSELKDIVSFKTYAIPLLYQTGYLTIKEFDPMFDSVVLTYPNDEVRAGFTNLMMEINKQRR